MLRLLPIKSYLLKLEINSSWLQLWPQKIHTKKIHSKKNTSLRVRTSFKKLVLAKKLNSTEEKRRSRGETGEKKSSWGY